jgi:hypothetical protein
MLRTDLLPRWPWRLLGFGALLVVAGACRSNANNGDAGTEVVPGDARTEVVVGDDLSGELPAPADVPGSWNTGGPRRLEIPDLGSFTPCDDEGATLASSAGDARILLTAVDDLEVDTETWLLHDPDGSRFDAIRGVFAGCVGERFEFSYDPVHDGEWSELELDVPADDHAAFEFAWGKHGVLDGGRDAVAAMRVGDVTSFVSVRGGPPDDPYDSATLDAVLRATTRNLTDGQAAPGTVQDAAPPELAVAAEVAVGGEGDVVVRPSDGCRFFEGNDLSYGVSAPGDFADELSANTNWLVEQVFAIERDVTVNVHSDRVVININLVGTPPPGLADDLRTALGRHSVC